MSIVLDVKELRIWLPTAEGPLLLVDGVDLAVRGGTVHGIAGESGSGKSISVQSIMGLLTEGMVREGTLTLNGVDISRVSARRQRAIRGSEIAMVFQDPMNSLHPMLTISKQLTEHVRLVDGVDAKIARERARDLLTEVRIPNPELALSSYPHQFSGGMRQRIAIAMALAGRPSVLIADEPTTALDVTVQAGILRLIRRLCFEHDLAVVLITHDLGVMAAVADELTIMYAGRVIESGPTAAVLGNRRHPYTDELIKALPRPDSTADERLVPIRGEAATPKSRPSGCAFHPRCPYALSECSVEVPPLLSVEPDHRAACPVDPLSNKVQL